MVGKWKMAIIYNIRIYIEWKRQSENGEIRQGKCKLIFDSCVIVHAASQYHHNYSYGYAAKNLNQIFVVFPQEN